MLSQGCEQHRAAVAVLVIPAAHHTRLVVPAPCPCGAEQDREKCLYLVQIRGPENQPAKEDQEQGVTMLHYFRQPF